MDIAKLAINKGIKFRLHLAFKSFLRRLTLFQYGIISSVRYRKALLTGKCYYGPFTGEFGHLLGHNLPFIAHLYSKGVQVEFCGLEIHRPFFKDEEGKPIVSSYLSTRDYFSESAPDCNIAPEPKDVASFTSGFIKEAKNAKVPYWDNADHDYYFYSFRWWVLNKGYIKVFDLSKIYKTKDERAVVIFPRKWNANFPGAIAKQLKNNGENWDYRELARSLSPLFDKVYVIGHPVFSAVDFTSFDNVEVVLTNENAFILEKCSNSQLIISQHSGTVYLGEYTNTPVLIIYKGGTEIGDIEITKLFKKGLGNKHEFSYAFSTEEIIAHVKQL